MGAAAAIGAAGTVGSAAQQARAAQEQADTAIMMTDADIAERQRARDTATALSSEATGYLGQARDQALFDLAASNMRGLSSLGVGKTDAERNLDLGQSSALGSLAAGYGGAQSALGAGYQSALADWARLGPTADTVGASGVMGLGESALQRGFATDPAAQWRYGQGLSSASRAGADMGMGGRAEALARYAAGGAAQEYGASAGRELAARQLGLGALEAQAARQDAMRRGQTELLAQYGAQGGQELANYLATAGQSLAGQQYGTASALAQLASQRGAEGYGAESVLGTQLASLGMTGASNLASLLTGQGQLGAQLATGVDRSALVNAAGSAARDSAAAWRDVGQLGFMLTSQNQNRGGNGYSQNDLRAAVKARAAAGY